MSVYFKWKWLILVMSCKWWNGVSVLAIKHTVLFATVANLNQALTLWCVLRLRDVHYCLSCGRRRSANLKHVATYAKFKTTIRDLEKYYFKMSAAQNKRAYILMGILMGVSDLGHGCCSDSGACVA